MMQAFSLLKNIKTLLVDDDKFVRDSMNLAFKLNGWSFLSVKTAKDGLEALEIESFDIIISDFRLPEINGLEFFKLMDEVHPNRLKVLISACISSDIESEAIANGVHKIIEKPFCVHTLFESLNDILEAAENSTES